MKKALMGLSIIAALSPAVVNAAVGDVYIGASVGRTELDLSGAEEAELATLGASVSDDDDVGWKAFAGWRAHENFAFEAFYVDLGEATITDGVTSVTSESDSFGFSALGIVPVADNFELFGKVGFHAWDSDFRATTGVSASSDDTDLMYGVGATYTFDQVSFRAEYEIYELDDADIDLFSAGATFNF